MSAPDRMSATRRIAVPADVVFALITDPHGHVAIDGSGMLVAPVDAEPVRAIGDTFVMDMDREPLGDLPLGRYQVLNTVTAFEDCAHLEWAVGGVGRTPIGHVYGYLLASVDGGATDVTSYCDWSGVSERFRAAMSWPVVPLASLERSLENLEKAVTTRA